MANDFYTPSSVGAAHTTARSSTVDSQFSAVEDAFDLLPTEAELKEDRVTYCTDTGAADAYVVALTYVPAAYTEGMTIRFKATAANTGASTINVNSLGVKTIKRYDGDDLSANDIVAGTVVTVTYDGTNFRLSGPLAGDITTAAAAAVSATASAAAASSSASAASSSASAASSSASAAAASAATFPTPVADTLLVRNAGNTAYETKTIAQTQAFLSVITQGLHSIWLPAAAFTPRTGASPCTAGSHLVPTSNILLKTMDFSGGGTTQVAVATLSMPRSWDYDNSTPVVYADPIWTGSAGSGDVRWTVDVEIFGGTGDLQSSLGGAFAGASVDTYLAAYQVHTAPEATLLVLKGGGGFTPINLAVVTVSRTSGHASDTNASDAWLLGVMLKIDIDLGNDDP